MARKQAGECRIVQHRSSGIVCHLTSLPSPFGVGDMGPHARRFVDLLAEMGQGLWQVLPLGPTGFGNSPYMSLSAFAGNPLLISPELLVEDELLDASDLSNPPGFNPRRVDYDEARTYKWRMLQQAYARFRRGASRLQPLGFEEFCTTHASWLEDFALFAAAREAHGFAVWSKWELPLARRESEALARWRDQLAHGIELQKFVQWLFFRQWQALREYCHSRGVEIIGDIPIYVAFDSADVWAGRKFFRLNRRGEPRTIAGVPPDYFSSTGQRWGNPIYRWRQLQNDRDRWWIDRFRMEFSKCDILRIDHFRGFEAYWEIPAEEPTAVNGRWVKGPGRAFFERIRNRLAELGVPMRIIAEDLGVITPQVDALRERLGFPGMRILQVAFGNDNKSSDYQPHNYICNCVAYTATHDHNTTVGWFTADPGTQTTQAEDEVRAEREHAMRYCNSDGREIHWDFIRLVLQSVARVAMFPLQDVLGLGTEARMNRPGSGAGNWEWRFTFDEITPSICERLAELTRLYERGPLGEKGPDIVSAQAEAAEQLVGAAG